MTSIVTISPVRVAYSCSDGLVLGARDVGGLPGVALELLVGAGVLGELALGELHGVTPKRVAQLSGC